MVFRPILPGEFVQAPPLKRLLPGRFIQTPFRPALPGNIIAVSNETDPLAGIPFALRLQTHRGDNVPLGLYQDVACTIPAVNDFDPVAAWRDELSQSGLLATQPNPDNQPVLTFIGGVPTITFDGIDDYLELLGVNYNLASRTVYCIAREVDPVNGSGAVVFHAGSGNDFNQDDALCCIGFESFPSNLVVAGGVGVAYLIQRAGAKPTPWAVFTETLGGGNGELFADGVSVGTDTYGSFTTSPNLLLGARYIGGISTKLSGQISAVLLSDGEHTPTERGTVETYLATLVP